MSILSLRQYSRRLYKRTMQEAYERAYREVVDALFSGGNCLDCGASGGQHFAGLQQRLSLEKSRYAGIEWDLKSVEAARNKGLDVIPGNLNKPLPYESDSFRCVFAFSVLEHLTNGCLWMQEAKRVLQSGGSLIILTPNISTFFTIALLLAGKMPSSGPHPDSEILLRNQTLFQVSDIGDTDPESGRPVHRHMVVFSFQVLQAFLKQIGFRDVRGYGFGLYPFPNFIQPILEKLDPYHCHQMVFKAEKGIENERVLNSRQGVCL